MDERKKALAVVAMVAAAAEALAGSGDAEQIVCERLLRLMDADAALCLSPGPGGAEVLTWSPSRDLIPGGFQAIAAGLPQFSTEHLRVMRDERHGEVIVLAPVLRDSSGSPWVPRLLLVARSAGFGPDQRALADHLVPVLAAMLPQVVADADERRREAAGRRAAKERGLTDREVEVLRLLAHGLLATSIAARLSLSPRTVHKHLGNIYEKLGVHDRLVAVNIARELSLVAR